MDPFTIGILMRVGAASCGSARGNHEATVQKLRDIKGYALG
jgi:hypothetical protein